MAGMIFIDGNGLQPHLESFMFDILRNIQRRHAQVFSEGVMQSDVAGMAAEPFRVLPVQPPPISNTKPAIAGLGTVADGDHRLGRF